MYIGVPAESAAGETRVAATPETVKKLVAQGHSVCVQSGAGVAASAPDAAYQAVGAEVVDAASALGAELVLKVRAPSASELALMRPGATLVGMLNPFDAAGLAALAQAGLTSFALEGEAGQAGLGQRRQAGRIKGVEHADQGGAGAHEGQLGRAGRAHLEHQFGPKGAGGIDHLGPDRLVGGVGGAGGHAGAALHAHAVALRHQFFDRFGRGSDPGFACRAFGRNTNVHMQLLQLNLTIRA